MNKLVLALLCVISFAFFSISSHAVEPISLGQVASNLMEPISVFSDFIHTACFVIGGSFIFASIIRYVEHRKSPLVMPISTIILMLILGIILLLLPYISLLTENGVSYALIS